MGWISISKGLLLRSWCGSGGLFPLICSVVSYRRCHQEHEVVSRVESRASHPCRRTSGVCCNRGLDVVSHKRNLRLLCELSNICELCGEGSHGGSLPKCTKYSSTQNTVPNQNAHLMWPTLTERERGQPTSLQNTECPLKPQWGGFLPKTEFRFLPSLQEVGLEFPCESLPIQRFCDSVILVPDCTGGECYLHALGHGWKLWKSVHAILLHISFTALLLFLKQLVAEQST